MKKHHTFWSSVTMAAMLGLSSLPATAQEVRLIGKDSNINVVGTILSTRDGKYLVRTAIGEFFIEQALVNCEGAACPSTDQVNYDIKISTPDAMAERLLPILTEGFAGTLDGEAELLTTSGVVISDSSDGGGRDAAMGSQYYLALTDFDGEPIANFGLAVTEGATQFELLASKEVQLVFSEKSAKKRYRDAVKAGGGGNLRDFDQERVVAMDGYVVIAHPANGTPSITRDQIADVFAGNITNWADLGGGDMPINVYSHADGTDAFHEVEALILNDSGAELSENANIVETDREMTAAVTSDPGGFGMLGFARIRGARAIPLLTSCGMTQTPSKFTIKTEEYELQHRVVVYNRADVTGYGREFIDYLDTPALDGLVSKSGYVDLSIVGNDQVEYAERFAATLEESEDEFELSLMEDLLRDMNVYERLSTTFRFAPGSNRLDNKAKRDLRRMLDYIAERKPDELVVAGFTDNKGPFDPNLTVSRERAEAILVELQKAATNGELDGVELKAKGYGELEPVACNTTARGRAANRRVEIWLE